MALEPSSRVSNRRFLSIGERDLGDTSASGHDFALPGSLTL